MAAAPHVRGKATRSAALTAAAILTAACATAHPDSRAVSPAGTRRTDAHGVEQVWVPPGSFWMGTDAAAMQAILALSPPGWVAKELPSEQPAHAVRLTSGFWIDRTEVTNEAFADFVRAGGYRDRSFWSDAGWAWLQGHDAALPLPDTGGPDHPRVRVTWYEAAAYARWRGGRLPTEAEWEFAARGPKGSLYPWGDAFDAARCNVVGATSSEPVGSHPTGDSWVGARDMAGNAMEWVQDWLDVAWYRHSPASDPRGPETGRVKVEKGGWWGSNPFVARAAYRHYEDPPDYGDAHIGFRIVTDQASAGDTAGDTDPRRNFALETLADGVVAVVRQDPAGLMVDANDVFIVNDDDVVVVDTNGNPSITREVLAALKRLTPKPVRYVVNTHYHDDHIRGNSVYRDAFPGVAFVAHPFARDYLPAQGAENRKSFLTGAPDFLEQLKGMLAKNESLFGGELTAEERTSMESDVRLASAVLENGAAAETVLPTITVADRMVLHRGRRTIEILALGSGHTAADLVVHLPAEGVVITGDLVAWPVPLVGSPQSHVAEWATTLGRIRDLHPKIIVPGHGPVLRDDRYLVSLQEMFAAIDTGARAAAARGETLAQARQAIDLKPFKDALAGESRVRRLLFSTYVAGPAVEAAFTAAQAAAQSGREGGAPRTAW